jgi:hypothetical protein
MYKVSLSVYYLCLSFMSFMQQLLQLANLWLKGVYLCCFSSELDNGVCDDLLPAKEKERLAMLTNFDSSKWVLPKTFHEDVVIQSDLVS